MRQLNMKQTLTAMTFVVGFLGLGPASLTRATENPEGSKVIILTGAWSGSYHTTETDTDGDGQVIIQFSGGFKSNLGKGTFDAVAENPDLLPNPTNCPPGNLGVPNPTLENIVLRFHTGDLLFVEVREHTGCFDPRTLTFTFLEKDAIIIGGTGRFANATGTFEDDTLAPLLLVKPTFRLGFLTGKIKARVTLDHAS